jgi:periplasmic protein TonB
MEMAQTMESGAGVLPVPMLDIGMSLLKPGDMSRAFMLAVGLHLTAAMLLVAAIRYWPAVAVPPRSPHLELDLTATPARPSPSVIPDPPALAQALASVPSEVRSAVMPVARVPEARQLTVPEPAVSVSPVGATWEPVMPEPGPEAGQVLGSLPLPERASSVTPSGDRRGCPTALSEIQPHYPYAARTRGEAGRVTVHVKVTSGGDVDTVRVSSSSGFTSLDESALVATRKAHFKPAERDGRAVPADIELQFDFRLQD